MMRYEQKLPYRERGFTIIELVVVLGFSVIVIAVAGLIEHQLTRVAGFVNQELSNQQGLEQALQTFQTDVRALGPSSIGGYGIESATSSSVVFYSDIDADAVYERVRYTITSTTFERGTVEPSGNPLVYTTSSETVRSLVTNVLSASSSFLFFTGAYTGSTSTYATSTQSIRVITLNLYADVQPSLAPQPTFFTTTITIRNLRSL